MTTDPNFENVTLLLHGDGTNGGQNNTFVDGSTNNFTITRNGNTTQGTFSPYGDNWSNYFDGTGDYLRLAPGAAFAFGTGDFTVELWVYPVAQSTSTNGGIYLIDARNASQTTAWLLGTNLAGTAGNAFVLGWSDGSADLISTGTLTQNGWNHVVYARSGTTGSLFLNGTRVATKTDSKNYNISPTQSTIGSRYDGTLYQTNGYISNIRTVKGTAVYDPTQTTLTVPTAPLTAITNTSLLTCQSNRFRDASTNNFTITRNGDVSVQRFSPFSPTAAYAAGTIGGSGYFDGTGDYLTAPDNAAFDFGTGDFTIEAWVYIVGNSSLNSGSTREATVFASFPTSSGTLTNSYGVSLLGSSTTTGTGINLSNWQAGAQSVVSATVTIPQASWNHIAVARSGTTTKLFLNGAEVGSGTLSNQTVNSGQNLAIGRLGYPGYIQELNGYISDLRVLKGTAQYTGTYTVPTAPLTAITNTSLLLNFTNAAILDNAMMAVPETVGNAQISTSVKKYGTGSLAFDGTGDWLLVPNSPVLTLSGDFTIEAWVYVTAGGANRGIVTIGNRNTTTGISLFWQSSTVFKVYVNSAELLGTSTGLGLNTWAHVAVTRSGTAAGNIKIYLNGVFQQQIGTANNTAFTGAAANGVCVGASYNGSFIEPHQGYIDDLRITNGVARYTGTGNFTVPTAAFPDL